MGQRQQHVFPFPLKGKHEGAAYRQQPEGTTPDALNVRAFDAIANRLRGGQRNGTSKYAAAAVNGTNPIQAISQLTTAFDPTAVVAGTSIAADEFAYADNTKLGTVTASWTTYYSNMDQSQDIESHYIFNDSTSTYDALVTGGKIASVATGTGKFGAVFKTLPTNSVYVLRMTVNTVGDNDSARHFAFLLRCLPTGDTTTKRQYYAVEIEPTGAATVLCNLLEFAGISTMSSNRFVRASISATLPGGAAWTDNNIFECRVNGNLVRLYMNGYLIADFSGTPITSYTSHTYVGFGGGYASGGSISSFIGGIQRFELLAATLPASLRSTELIVVSGGGVYHGSATALSIATGGTSALVTSGIVRMREAYSRMYFCDGTNYKVYNPVTGAVAAWIPTAGALPAGAISNVTFPITAASVTSKTFTVTGNATSYLPAGGYLVVSGGTGSPNNNGYYRVVSATYSAPDSTVTVEPAPLTIAVTGSPVMGAALRTCTMIALYRGRIVLSGLSSDPQNWFMSKVGDPLDWNYTPTTITQTMAVAGNNSVAGLMGDVITCLAPYNDDLMFMGGDHTLWVMRGDPAAGGMIDNISYQTGVAGPDAFTRDPEGNCYFFGAGTFWQMPAGSWVPQPLSRGVMDRTFGAIDYATFNVRLLWDENNKGVHLYFTPSSQPTTAPIHYFWDKRAGGFWPDTYPIVQGPTAVWNYDADLPTDRAMLLGGFDSYLRQIPAAIQKDDDGTTIHSYVRYAPQIIGGDLANSRLSELTPIMSKTSDPASIRVYAAGTPEAVAVATVPQVSHVLSAGRNSTMRQRVTGNAIAIELENVATAWATATYYAAGVQVLVGTTLYTCIAPHTSTTGGAHPTPSTPNTTDWTAGTTRSWAVESVVGVMDAAGKVRSGRL